MTKLERLQERIALLETLLGEQGKAIGKMRQEQDDLLADRAEARQLVRELMPHVRAEDPHSVRFHEHTCAKYPWIREGAGE